MANFDEFYQVWNIIGYTGKLNELPTVYFLSDEFAGHITQQHRNPRNVGRDVPSPREGYVFGNIGIPGINEIRLVETHLVQGWDHVSRNAMVFIDQAKPDMKVVSVLAQAIWRCKGMKSCDLARIPVFG